MKFLFENLIGIMSITILVLNTVILSCLLIPLGIIKFLLPITSLKVLFTKFKNTSKLSIIQSDKETEIASFLHSDLKESLYFRIKKTIY